jgi:HD superfamily phosphohydrolase
MHADAQHRVTSVIGTALLHTRWLRRLGSISFLGTLDGHPRSRRASSRLEHSMGVAALGADAARTLGLSEQRTRELVVACLLHDVGHYPLSHSAELAFASVLGPDHHQLSEWIIRGGGPIPRARSLARTLERLDVDPDRVWAIIDGSERGPRSLGALLHGRINLDTLEGVPRAATSFRVKTTALPGEIFVWAGDELAIDPSALDAMDAFWGLKDRVYDEVINLPSNVLAEARLSEVVKRRITADVLERLEYFDDRALHRFLADDLVVLDAADDASYDLHPRSDAAILVRMRKRYRVDRRATAHDPGATVLSRDRWATRYQHDRVPGYLVSRDRQLPLPGMGVPPPVFEAPEIE